MNWRRILLIISLLTVGLVGCETYRRFPLDSSTVDKKLIPPDTGILRVQAREIKHPILKPLDINFQDGLSPDEAAVLAVLVNPSLKAIRDKRGIAAAQVLQAGILPNPSFGYTFGIPMGGSTQGTVNAYGFSLDYEIQSLVTKGAEKAAARAHAASVDLDIAWQEWQVAESAKLHTYRLFYYQEQLSVAREIEGGLWENYETVKRAFDSGFKTLLDLSAAEASLNKAHVATLTIEQRQEEERLALNKSLGFPPERSIPLQQGWRFPSFDRIPSQPEILAGLEDRRLDLVALRKGYQSQEERLRAAILGQFPKITIGIDHARDTTNVITTGPSIMIGLPIFDRNQGHIAVEGATRQRLFDEYVSRVFDTRAEVAAIFVNADAVQRQIRAAERSLPILEEVVRKYHQALLEGNGDVLTYYNARDKLNAARLALLGLKLSLAEFHNALEIASGEFLPPTEGSVP